MNRLELVILREIQSVSSRTGSGFGKYPLGAKDVIEAVLPLCSRDDPAWPSIERAWAAFLEKMER